METPRLNVALACLPPGGGLVAVGGYKGTALDVVEGLFGDDAHKWRPLAPLPSPLNVNGVVFFRQRLLVAGGDIADGNYTSNMLAFNPPTLGGSGQWSCLKPQLPNPVYPACAVVWGREVFLVGKPFRESGQASVLILMDPLLSLGRNSPVEVFKFCGTNHALEDEVAICSFFCDSPLWCFFILSLFLA